MSSSSPPEIGSRLYEKLGVTSHFCLCYATEEKIVAKCEDAIFD